jgi:excisionase family DNA binding protein
MACHVIARARRAFGQGSLSARGAPQRWRSIHASAALDKTPDHGEEPIRLLADDTIPKVNGRFSARMSQRVESEQLVFRVTEAATLLGISRSGLYEMIYKREIGVVRFGNRSIRIPKSEIERFLAGSLIPPRGK